MCKIKEQMQRFLEREWSLPEKIFWTATWVLFGMLVGFCFSPIKKGIKVNWSFGCHNGSNNGNDNKGNLGNLEKKEKQNPKKKEEK